MKIAVFCYVYPALTESFVRREVRALKELGHDVSVFIGRPWVDSVPVESVPGVPVRDWREVAEFKPDVIYAEMGYPAHSAAVMAARQHHIPYVLRLWSGLDSLGLPESALPLYRVVSEDPLCLGVIVEDAFMVKWAADRLWIALDKLLAVPNSLFLETFARARTPKPNVVLAIGRFVPKKGLIHLVRAIQMIDGAELWLVGSGPEDSHLRSAAQNCSAKVKFLGVVPESDLPALYAEAALLAAPCVRMSSGDADGVPTVVLEAIAAGCPVIASDLLSAHCYIQHETGVLVPPGDEKLLAEGIEQMLLHPEERQGGRGWARKHLDIRKNILQIETVLAKALVLKDAA